MADNALMQRKRPGPAGPMPGATPGGVNPNSQRIVHELAQRAGFDVAAQMRGSPTNHPSAFKGIYEQALKAAASVAATDMELEAVDQMSGVWGVASPFSQGGEQMKLGGPERQALEQKISQGEDELDETDHMAYEVWTQPRFGGGPDWGGGARLHPQVQQYMLPRAKVDAMRSERPWENPDAGNALMRRR